MDTTRLLDSDKKDIEKKPGRFSNLSKTFVTVGAYCIVLYAAVVNSLAVATVQQLDGSLPEAQLNIWRFFIQFLMILPFVAKDKSSLSIKTSFRTWGLLALIVAANMCQITFYYYALQFIPLSLMKGLSIVLVMIGNSIVAFCRKSLNKIVVVMIVIGIVGVFLMIQPEAIFADLGLHRFGTSNFTSRCRDYPNITDENGTVIEIEHGNHFDQPWIGYIMMFVFAIGRVGFLELSEWSKGDNISTNAIIFWSSLINTIISIIIAAIFELPVLFDNWYCIALLFAHIFGSSFNNVMVCKMTRFIPVIAVSMIINLNIVLLLIYQYTWMQRVNPGLGNSVEIAGGVFCFIGFSMGPLWQMYAQIKDQKKKKKEDYEEIVGSK